MAETLLQKQQRFAKVVPRLIDKAHELGFKVTHGDAYRDERVFGKLGQKLGYGNAFSCHKVRLAIDLNLYKDGKYLENTADHQPLGEWWEALAPDHCWGGRFQDGNHYSITHEGIK
jgi:hypothetical protein